MVLSWSYFPKLHVEFIPPNHADGPLIPRHYTLVHADIGSDLYLTIGPDYHRRENTSMFVLFLLVEFLAEWKQEPEGYALHAHCNIERSVFISYLYTAVLRSYFPRALEAIRYGDRHLFDKTPNLDQSKVFIHIHPEIKGNDWTEYWQTMGEYTQEKAKERQQAVELR